MATSRMPGPVRSEIPAIPGSGTIVRCAAALPGIVGRATGPTNVPGARRLDASLEEPIGGWFDADLDEIPGVTLPDNDAVVVCIAPADHDEAGYRRVEFDADQCARPVAEHCVAEADAAGALQDWSGLAGPLLVAWLTGQLEAGKLKILWRYRYELAESRAEAAAAVPAPRRVAAPSAPAAPSPLYSTFPPGFDAAASAQVLREAAASGVPFCEECMKARAAAGSSAEAG